MMVRPATLLAICAVVALGGYESVAGEDFSLTDLRCEYRVDPLGIDVVKPRLSWVLESNQRGQKQTAYRVLVASSPKGLEAGKGDLWDSGKVDSDRTIHVAYAGKPLTSRMRCWWNVRVWDKDGKESAESKPGMWSMGLLRPGEWEAQWIADPRDARVNENGPLPATILRKSFAVDGAVKRATVHVSGMGLYELHLNGKRVGDRLLAPEFTMYGKRVQYQTFDVTGLLVPGDNAVGAILGDGWNGEYFFGMPLSQAQRPFQGRRGLVMRLDIELANGKTQTLVTDKSWRSTRDGPIRSGSLYDGEVYDARMEMPGWDKAGFDDALWHPALIADYFADVNLVWQRNEPIRVVKELKPVKLTEPRLNSGFTGTDSIGTDR